MTTKTIKNAKEAVAQIVLGEIIEVTEIIVTGEQMDEIGKAIIKGFDTFTPSKDKMTEEELINELVDFDPAFEAGLNKIRDMGM